LTRVFNKSLTLEALQQLAPLTMVEHLGITFTAVGDDFIEARMPVDHRTCQPYGLLHGGASVALAETLGSIAAAFSADPTTQYCVGIEINANHLKSVRSGYVTGIAKPLRIGKRIQVWQIHISNEENDLICVSRITLAVLDKKP
jgi:1,4-dihydroxy-2-naphthoyl-CoA hydrolase